MRAGRDRARALQPSCPQLQEMSLTDGCSVTWLSHAPAQDSLVTTTRGSEVGPKPQGSP